MTRTLILALLSALFLEHGYGQSSTKPPVLPPAFEVASITPCKPGTPAPPMEHAGIVQFTFPGGRFNAGAATLKSLVEWAYGIQPAQYSGGPSWMNTDRYDITAKAADNATDAQMKLMLQALLAERFQLKFHHEQKDLTVYVISTGKNAAKLTQPKDAEVHALRMARKPARIKNSRHTASSAPDTLLPNWRMFSRGNSAASSSTGLVSPGSSTSRSI